MSEASIAVEVVYGTGPQQQVLRALTVPVGSSVRHVIMRSNLLAEFPELDLTEDVGIFSKRASLETKVQAGDRVEIYRSLKIDPKQARFERVRKKR